MSVLRFYIESWWWCCLSRFWISFACVSSVRLCDCFCIYCLSLLLSSSIPWIYLSNLMNNISSYWICFRILLGEFWIHVFFFSFAFVQIQNFNQTHFNLINLFIWQKTMICCWLKFILIRGFFFIISPPLFIHVSSLYVD